MMMQLSLHCHFPLAKTKMWIFMFVSASSMPLVYLAASKRTHFMKCLCQGQYPALSQSTCSFLCLLKAPFYQPGYILSAAIAATPLLFTRQLTMTPGRSQRSAGSKGSGGWEAPGCKCLAATSVAWNDCLSTWCLQRCQTLVSSGLAGRDGRWLNRECADSDGDVEGRGGQWVHYHSGECTSLCCVFRRHRARVVLSLLVSVSLGSAASPHLISASWWLFDSRAGRRMPPPPTVLLKHSWSLMTLPST